MGQEHDETVKRIIELEADAARLEADADECRWQAAELIARELETGISQRQLAREIGKSEGHVRRMRKCWELGCVLKDAERPRLNALYNSAQVRGGPGEPATVRPVLTAEPEPAEPEPALVRQLRHEAEVQRARAGQLERQLADERAVREILPPPGPVNLPEVFGLTPDAALTQALHNLTQARSYLAGGQVLAGPDLAQALTVLAQITITATEIRVQLTGISGRPDNAAPAEPGRGSVAETLFGGRTGQQADEAWRRIKDA